MGRYAGDVDLGGLHLPAQVAAQNVHRNGLAHIGCGGEHGRRAQQVGNTLAHGVGPAHMAGEHRDDELARIVHHRHAGVFVLGLQHRGNQAHHSTERDEKHQLVVARKQRAHLVTQGTFVGAHGVGQAVKRLRKLGGGADMGSGQVTRQLGGLRRAVAGDGDDADAGLLGGTRHLGRGRGGGHSSVSSAVLALSSAGTGDVFLRQPLMRSPRMRCGFFTIMSER